MPNRTRSSGWKESEELRSKRCSHISETARGFRKWRALSFGYEIKAKMNRPRYRLWFLIALLLGCIAAWLSVRWWISTINRPYHAVEKGLYIGRAVDTPPRGTIAVANVCGRQNPYQVQTNLWEPVLTDDNAPSLEWLERVVDFITEQRQAGHTTYVHCLAGQNRSGTAVTAYLMQKHSWNRDKALAFLKKRRSQVQPNPFMMQLLDDWENKLQAEQEHQLDSE